MKRIFISLGIILYGCIVFAFTPKITIITQQNENQLNNRHEMTRFLTCHPSKNASEVALRIWKEKIFSSGTFKAPAFQIDAATIKLDSALVTKSSGIHVNKHVVTYNNAGHYTSYTTYNWEEENEEWQRTKLDYEYNSAGGLKEVITSFWDASTSSWMKFSKATYTYTSNGKIETIASFSWIEQLKQWYGINKNDYFYFNNGKVERIESYSWDMMTNAWIILNKTSFHYDSNGNNDWSESKYFDNVSLEWTNQNRFEMTYDNSGNETLYTAFDWDESELEWVGYYRHKTEYDSNGNEIRFTTYSWDEMKPGWIEEDKTEYVYDSNGYLTKYTEYDWDANATKWIEEYKTELKHDNKGNVTEVVDFNYDSNTSNWINDSKDEYSYDSNNTASSLLANPISFWTNYNLIQVKHFTANEQGVWDSEYEITKYFYSPFSGTGLPNTLNNNIHVFPNPVKDMLHIQYEADALPNVKLYNLAGQLLLSSRSKQINMKEYAPGMYIIDINDKKVKIIKE